MKAVEVAPCVEVETTNRGRLEKVEVAEIPSLAQGEVEEIPRDAGVAFQKKFELSCERAPPAPVNRTEPEVRKEKA